MAASSSNSFDGTPFKDARALFDLNGEIAYLNCAYMSPLMRSVAEAGERGIRSKMRPWTLQPQDFFTGADRARSLFARIVGADAEGVAVVPAASYGLAVAAKNLPLAKGQSVILLEGQFPANVYVWREKARAAAAEIRMLSSPDPVEGWTDKILGAIDETTAILALPHCHWADGALIDLERVCRAAKEVGAAVVLDLTQSAGAMPIDVRALDVDFAVAATYKWLMGPYGLGFLYIAERHRDGRPLEETWIGRQGSEDFTGLVNYVDAYAPGARRFDMGERAQFHLMPMAIAAMEQLLAWDIARLYKALSKRNEAWIAQAEALGARALPQDKRAGHYVGLRFPGIPTARLAEALKRANVQVSFRGEAMRVTPHVYNTDEEIARLLQVFQDVQGAARTTE